MGEEHEEGGGAAPMLMAHRQIMKVMNEERKPEKMTKGKQQKDMTRNPILNKKPVTAEKIG